MRYLGLDLGTKSCGISISDKNNVLCFPKEPIFYDQEDYENLLKKILAIILEDDITDVVLGLPKNMDGSMGFAAQRSIDFASRLKEKNIVVHFVDERLSTVEAMS